jgi:hypothetical protein
MKYAPAMAKKLFLVYEIETQRAPSAGGTGRAKVRVTNVPRGCHFARDAEAACIKAADEVGRRGLFAAVPTALYDLEFKAKTLGKKDVAKLLNPKRRG